MAETMYALTSQDVARLRALLNAFESGELDIGPAGGPRRRPADRVVVGALTSPVSATTALLGSPKSGTLNVYAFASTTGSMEDTTRDITCWNFAPQIATTDRWTICERENVTGRWVITTQFCS